MCAHQMIEARGSDFAPIRLRGTIRYYIDTKFTLVCAYVCMSMQFAKCISHPHLLLPPHSWTTFPSPVDTFPLPMDTLILTYGHSHPHLWTPSPSFMDHLPLTCGHLSFAYGHPHPHPHLRTPSPSFMDHLPLTYGHFPLTLPFTHELTFGASMAV